MLLEERLVAVLLTACPRVFPDEAPWDTPRPYVIYEQFGGQADTYLEGEVPSLRNGYMQISVWADTRAAAVGLMLAVEAALVRANSLQAEPQAALAYASADAGEVKRYGAQQDFSVWADR